MRIDAHAHVFHRGLKLAARRYTPHYDAPLDRYLRRLDENGLTHGVLVQPSFLGTDNSYLVDSLVAAAGRLRGIAVVDPAVSQAALRRLDRAGIAGIRLNLIGRPLPELQSPPWPELLAKVASLGWQVEIQRNATDLADLVPQLLAYEIPIVLDHFTLPDPKLGVEDPGFAKLLTFGAARRVWVKISAPYRNGPEGEAFAVEAYPLLRQALGPDRLLWGSDWPHTQFEAGQDYPKNRAFLDRLAPDAVERAQILENGKTLFRF
jgi:predicted TIM-barrel fold metal-dependent hydrolase